MAPPLMQMPKPDCRHKPAPTAASPAAGQSLDCYTTYSKLLQMSQASTYVQMLNSAGLDPSLQPVMYDPKSKYTVMVPSNTAWQKLAADLGTTVEQLKTRKALLSSVSAPQISLPAKWQRFREGAQLREMSPPRDWHMRRCLHGQQQPSTPLHHCPLLCPRSLCSSSTTTWWARLRAAPACCTPSSPPSSPRRARRSRRA